MIETTIGYRLASAAIQGRQLNRNREEVTTVGKVRAAGGDMTRTPTKKNPNHATRGGLTPEQASSLFRPTIKNPNPVS
jgi:hypothetical protein